MEIRSMIGKRLMHFEIEAELGIGGMGEVYRARDTKLGRLVAIKVLPDSVASNPERLSRFEREARVLAALNHPNVAAVYSFETAEVRDDTPIELEGEESRPNVPVRFLVMELVEGKTLDELIPEGGMPLERFFEIAQQLAGGVAAAHEKGIVHRDLKPSNVMVSDQERAKVLDFGVAKLEEGFGREQTDLKTEALTVEGRIVGTVPYMSPEQVKAQSLDARTDIFSLGSIFYQMITGSRPFDGPSPPEILAAILKDEPKPVRDLRPEAPRQLDRIVRHCLAKDPKLRYQSARDLTNALSDLRQELDLEHELAMTKTREPHRGEDRRVSGPWPKIFAMVVVLVAAAAIWQAYRQPDDSPKGIDSPGQVSQFAVQQEPVQGRLSQLTSDEGLEEWPAWSPLGDAIAYSADNSGFKNLFVRDLMTGQQRELTEGPSDDIQVAWSPDGTAVLFTRSNLPEGKLNPSDVMGWYVLGGDIWRVDLETGGEEKLIDDAFNPVYSPDGTAILVDADWAGPRRIWSTDTRGRNPKQLTNDQSEAAAHANPHGSPDGSMIVFRRIQQTSSDIYVMNLQTEAVTAITHDDYNDLDPRWSPDGRFIYFSSYRSGGLNLWRIPISSSGQPAATAQQVTRGPGNDLQVTLSPEGDRLAFSVLSLNSNLWRLAVDPESGEATAPPVELIASSREDSRGSWLPDRSGLVFNSDRAGEMNLWLFELDGRVTRQLTRGPGGDFQPQVAKGGDRVVFFSARSGSNDIWLLDMKSGEMLQLTEDPGLDINPFFSPDATQIVFQSDRDGRLELWLMGSDGTQKRKLTTVGSSGHFSPWTADGRAVIFRSSIGDTAKIYSLDVESLEISRLPAVSSGAHMSFSPDGRSILDVAGHKTLWIYDSESDFKRQIFEFENPSIRIDYPMWSPDGTEVVFDRAQPSGGDIWVLEGL